VHFRKFPISPGNPGAIYPQFGRVNSTSLVDATANDASAITIMNPSFQGIRD
jgi:hypothetical protein